MEDEPHLPPSLCNFLSIFFGSTSIHTAPVFLLYFLNQPAYAECNRMMTRTETVKNLQGVVMSDFPFHSSGKRLNTNIKSLEYEAPVNSCCSGLRLQPQNADESLVCVPWCPPTCCNKLYFRHCACLH